MARTELLIVDDDLDWVQYLGELLERDYTLHKAADGPSAIEIVKASPVVLAILDQRMRGDKSAGVQLLVRLREIRPNLRAIILTGHADLEDAVSSMKTGAVDYISKQMVDLPTQLRTRIASALANDPDSIIALMRKGEGVDLEFKSSARWDRRQQKISKDIEGVILKTIAAFLNSEIGGVLLIGVDDDGKAVGLKEDYGTLNRKDRDGYEAFLVNLMLGAYGKDVGGHIRVDFQEVDGYEVCRVSVRPSPRAVYVPDGASGEHLYIRAGNTTRQLTARETVEYCRSRWK